MKAERDLDFLISENVMGECAHRKHEKYVCQDDWGYLCVVCGSEEECPSYSSDISAVWKVVEKLNGRGLVVDIAVEKNICIVGICEMSPKIKALAHEWHPHLPLAICLAALKATENVHNSL